MPVSEAPLPTFLIIGAQKSGTRWLRVNLSSHPDICAAPQETHFFHSRARFESLGLEWYRAQFSGWAGEPILGEASPGYMMWRHRPRVVAKRIAETVPNVRLIAIVRNPVDRARSALIHHIKLDRLRANTNLLELIGQKPPEHDPLSLVSGGWYAASLKPYQQLFGDQLLVLLHDDITDDPRGAYKRAVRHVGASPDFVPPDLNEILFSNQPHLITESAEAPNAAPELSGQERQQVYAYFRDDVRELEKMIGRDLSRWDPGGTYSVQLNVNPWRTPPPRAPWTTATVISWYEGAAAWIEGLVGAVRHEQYGLPTPCPEWNVRDLLTKIIALPYQCAATLRRVALPVFDEGDSFITHRAATAYRAAADELLSAMNEPGRLEGKVESPFGEMPAAKAARFAFVNQLTHGWDLATATGQASTIPASLLEAADRVARREFSGIQRRPEFFAPEVQVSDAATPTERFVAFLGRDPASNPSRAPRVADVRFS
jgi:uncharacterized protein (TIGR03086 family)